MIRPQGFEVSICGRGDGTVEAVYFHFREEKSAKTVEVLRDTLLVDYNKRGQLIGIEVLGPVRISQIVKLVNAPRKRPFKRFLKETAPEELVLA